MPLPVLIGFVLAFIIGPWRLTSGQSAVVLLSSGIGAIVGAFGSGWIADRLGRRKVFILTVLNFSPATGTLYFTPDNDWVYLSVARFFVGLGVGGLYCVDLPLVQEFMPSAKRGWVSGLVTCVIPLGVGIGAVLSAYATPTIGWRGLFALGVLPALLALLVRVWVPESPRWLLRQGRTEEARESLAWAMQVNPQSLPLPTAERQPEAKTNWFDLFRYPRSLAVSWLGNAPAQTGVYGIVLWAPSLLVVLLKVTPQEASKMMILLTVVGFVGRISFSWLSERIGRRKSGGLLGLGAGALVILAGYNYNGRSVACAFADERHGFGLRLRRHRQNSRSARLGVFVKPDVPVPEIPIAFLYLGSWFLMAGVVYYFLGFETGGRSIEEIDRALGRGLQPSSSAIAL